MTPLSLILVLAIFGFIVWLVVTYIPMPPPVKNVIIVVAVVVSVALVVGWDGVIGRVESADQI